MCSDRQTAATNLASSFKKRFGIHIDGSDIVVKTLPHGKEIPPEFKQSPQKCAIYELTVSFAVSIWIYV